MLNTKTRRFIATLAATLAAAVAVVPAAQALPTDTGPGQTQTTGTYDDGVSEARNDNRYNAIQRGILRALDCDRYHRSKVDAEIKAEEHRERGETTMAAYWDHVADDYQALIDARCTA